MNEITLNSGTASPLRRVALPASIILNLFLVAIIAGHVIHTRVHRATAPVTPLARVLARADAILPPKDAAVFGAVILRDAPKYAAAGQRLREARERLETQIVAEPFNSTVTLQSLVAAQAAWDEFVGEFGGTLVDGLAQVSPEGRRKLMAETQWGRNSPEN